MNIETIKPEIKEHQKQSTDPDIVESATGQPVGGNKATSNVMPTLPLGGVA